MGLGDQCRGSDEVASYTYPRSQSSLSRKWVICFLKCVAYILLQGISDSPAWVVAKANQYARDHALTPFVIYQGAWNVLERSFEREIIPLARSEGLALAPWNVLAAGKIRTDEEEEKRRQTGEQGRTLFTGRWERNEKEKVVCKALEKVAAETGAKHITSGKFAYLIKGYLLTNHQWRSHT